MDVISRCAHCSRTMELTVDSDLNIKYPQDDDPMVFIPEVKIFDIEEPSITEVF